jgi:hypothetical protein
MFLDGHFEVTRKQVRGVCNRSLYRVLRNSGRVLKTRYKITSSLQIFHERNLNVEDEALSYSGKVLRSMVLNRK